MLQGQQYDWETGLFYNRHRYYDSRMHRYLSQDPIKLAGGLNYYAYPTNPVQWVDPLGLFGAADLPMLPQGVVDFSAGVGDGILATLSFGFVKGQDLRDALDIDGGVDPCSTEYKGGRVTGTAATLAVQAGGAIPKVLTHFTTKAGAAGIAETGLNASRGGLFGGGKYASSTGAFPKNPFVPPGSTVPVAIENTAGYVRAVPGTFVQSTAGGTAQLGAMNAGYGAAANRDMADCKCKLK